MGVCSRRWGVVDFWEYPAMRIKPRGSDAERRAAVKADLDRARAIGPLQDPVCMPDCPDHTAGVHCHRSCVKAPVRLSSDPDAFPIEPLIAPLVFEIKRLGVFEPCWSCEGHNDNAGTLWKVPRVWFYADSVAHVRALAEAVATLSTRNRLTVPWHVVLTHSDPDNPDTSFSLEPAVDAAHAQLPALQADIERLAAGVAEEFRKACEDIATHAG